MGSLFKRVIPTTREERWAEIERLTTIGLIACRRLWKLSPAWDDITQLHTLPQLPPPPTKPGELRRLAARLRAGIVPPDAVQGSVEDIEKAAMIQKRAVWCWHKVRALEARLKPLWAAVEAENQKAEQRAFHEVKGIAAAEPDGGMADSYRTMKRAFRKRVGRR